MILCCGEALIDMVPCRTAEGEAAFLPRPGGAALNTAIALGRLGVPVGLLAGLSRDMFGDQLRAALAACRVDCSMAVTSSRPTPMAFARLQDGQARYAFMDENSAGRMVTVADLPTLPRPLSLALFGGISLAAEPCGTAHEAVMELCASTCAIMIDPNIRPASIADEAAYRARLDRMIVRADIVKLSDEDLRWIAGTGDLAASARGLLERGPGLVLLTLGARGARAFAACGQVEVEATPARVADTIGAGDTFNAGVLAVLFRAGVLAPGLPALNLDLIRRAVMYGCRAAAVTVSRPGADPPWARELEGQNE